LDEVVVGEGEAEVVRGALRAERRSMMGQLVELAMPSIVSSVSVTVMHFTNNLMIARLDTQVPEAEKLNLAASMNGGMSAWVFVLAAMGVGTAVNTLSSQSLGRGEARDCGSYAWQGVWLAILSVLFFVPVSMLGWPLFGWLGHESNLVPLEARYFQIMALGAPLVLANGVLSNFFLGVHRPKIQMAAAITGNVVDTIVCYGLLFGQLGFPRVGLMGAAVAVIAGSLTSFLVLMCVFLSPGVARVFGSHRGWKLTRERLWQVIRLGIPAGIQQGSDMSSWAVFSVGIVGSFGAMYSAAQGTVMNFIMLSFMPAVGVGTAVNAMVGRKIGEKRYDLAHAAAFAGMKLAMTYMSICGVLIFLFRHDLAWVFLRDPDRAAVAASLLLLAALFQAFDGLNIVFISALRGAGDVRQPTVVMMSLAWGVCVGGGIIVAYTLPGLKALGPWIMATIYICLMAFYVLWRWRSEAWKKVDVFAVRA
jgi:MATE family multidrug resistance protein